MRAFHLFAALSPALAMGVALGLSGSAQAYEAIEVKEGATVAGTVRFLGAVPKAAELKITQDQKVCGVTPKHDESMIVSASKGLKNAVVFFQKIDKGAALQPGKALLMNTQCRYEPHVLAFVVGTELSVGNDDNVLHNTHIKLPRSSVFNYGLPKKGQIIKSVIRRKGLMKVGCDAGHVWMSAWVAAFDHPYFAVTDAEGRFSIANVPPGSYKLAYWHEKLGRKSKAITVGQGGKVDASLDLK